MDAVHYQKFQRYLLVYLAASSVLCLAIVLPVNVSQGSYGKCTPHSHSTTHVLARAQPRACTHGALSVYMYHNYNKKAQLTQGLRATAVRV